MEIGSFIELQFDKGKEYYNGEQVVRLNSGRAAIYHSVRCLDCPTVYLPRYQCETVREFLIRKGINIRYYNIGHDFKPLIKTNEPDTTFLLVNYFGIMSGERMRKLANEYSNVIIDNAQAFFAEPIPGCMNVYTARKFFGVPDGAYVVGEGACRFMDTYEQGYSSDTSLFLLQRIEYGCEGKAYAARMVNEERINSEDVKKMSALTQTILDGIDYEAVRRFRRENFDYACTLFGTVNQINPLMHYDESCVPMVYPLVVEDDGLMERLLAARHFQGRWWAHVLREVPEDSFEHRLSSFMVPITIDQRYGKNELSFVAGIVKKGFIK